MFTRLQLIAKEIIRRIKMKQKEIDQGIVIKMFDHLKVQVHMANQNVQSL